MAPLHRHGRVLPEWPAPHLDRLVYAASSTLVPCLYRWGNALHGTGPCLHAFPAAAHPHHLFLHRHTLADHRHCHRELHLPELPRPLRRLLLLDDQFLLRLLPQKLCSALSSKIWHPERSTEGAQSEDMLFGPDATNDVSDTATLRMTPKPWARHTTAIRLAIRAVFLTWIFYVTTAQLIRMLWRTAPLPSAPIAALEPFRIANQYGLFAVMTRGRYEIEFQGSNDGQNWTAYPFRNKPQALDEPPRIYAPYQPRFDWNLWFASLGSWREYPIVPNTEVRLLQNDKDVLALFAGDPFPQAPPL